MFFMLQKLYEIIPNLIRLHGNITNTSMKALPYLYQCPIKYYNLYIYHTKFSMKALPCTHQKTSTNTLPDTYSTCMPPNTSTKSLSNFLQVFTQIWIIHHMLNLLLQYLLYFQYHHDVSTPGGNCLDLIFCLLEVFMYTDIG